MSLPIAADRIEAMYRDAIQLAEASRGYFERDGAMARAALSPEARIEVATESVRITARLLHVVTWLLRHQDPVAGDASAPALAEIIAAPPFSTAFPEAGRRIAVAVRELYDRIQTMAAS